MHNHHFLWMGKVIRALSIIFTLFFLGENSVKAQQLIHHTTVWFGPNANPVPEFTDATIPNETQLTATADYYFSSGDKTYSTNIKIELPLIPEKVAIKVWATGLEYYEVTNEMKQYLNMHDNSGIATGDLYVQTRVSLFRELRIRPSVILNATLKTASGSGFKDRRFFNTAGYYFDVEAGKSILFSSGFLNEIRLAFNLGFFSWDVQTPYLNVQDDAPMYGMKCILKSKKVNWENTISGYTGWIHRGENYGNKPIVFASKIYYQPKKNAYFIQFQKGIRDYPFDQLRLGVTIPLTRLSPKFN